MKDIDFNINLIPDMEKYSRGRRGAPAKGVGRETAARVQIPPSPPRETQLNPMGTTEFFNIKYKENTKHE